MPVYNERNTLRKCIDRVLAAPLPEGIEREIIMVNDASTDGTEEVMNALQAEFPKTIRTFHQEINQGKGAAIRRAIQEIQGDYAIIQDADLEYDPGEYSVVLEPILKHDADVVYGSRFAGRKMRRVLNFHHELGNRFLTFLSNVFTGFNLTDMETCYKAFRVDLLKTIPLRSNRFGMEPEITAKISKRHAVVYEVPISYYGRTYEQGKKIGWKDAVSAFYTILKYWMIDDCYDERYGHNILANLSLAHRFNTWIAKTIQPFLGHRILEVGAGIGNISCLLPQKETLTLTDIDPVYIDILENAYLDNDIVDVQHLDIAANTSLEGLEGKYDTVVCLNVLEHIEDDEAALKRMYQLLEPGGRLVLLVPQYLGLYGSYDKELDHFRRYRCSGARALLEKVGYKVQKRKNINFLSIFGWWWNSCLLRRRTMSKFQLKCFDMLVPILRPIEAVLPLPGLSLILVAERSEVTQELIEK